MYRRDRRGTVAAWVALSAVPMLTLLAVALDVAQLSAVDVSLQRIADAAAMAGAMRYNTTGTSYPSICGSSGNRQSCAAVSAAADVGEINGIAAGTRNWNNSTQTLTDGNLTAAVIAGPVTSTDTAVKVTITSSSAAFLPLIANGPTSFASTVTAIAEIESVPGGGPQPCITALNKTSGATDFSMSLDGSVELYGCSIRTNEAMTMSGYSNVHAEAIYAGSTVTTSGYASIATTNGTFQNDGQISDPYASDTTIQNAFAELKTQTTTTFDPAGGTNPAASPGIYSSITIDGSSGHPTFNPGLYVVTGNLTFGGNELISGSGVTFVVGGTVTVYGNANVTLSPPTSSANGGIPGIIFAGPNTGAVTFGGAASGTTSGVIYFPNADITFTNDASGIASGGCFEVIGSEVSISGDTNFAPNCTGAASFGSLPATLVPMLVQ